MASTTNRAEPTAATTPDPADEHTVAAWPVRLASVITGVLWLTQLLWKLPWDSFGSPGLQPNPQPSAAQPGPFVDNGSGLYHWMTVEALNGNKLLPFYGDLIRNLVLPQWQLVAWFTVVLELVITLSLLLGLLTRLGGFLGLLQAVNLFLGLAFAPGEWYWSYGMLITLQLLFLLTGPGRVGGLDARLRPGLRRQMAEGQAAAGWLYKLT